MKNSVKWFVAGTVLSIALMLLVVPALLRSVNNPGPGSEPGASTSIEQTIAQRPNCPTRSVGGVDLPCLGGQLQDQNHKATVINVWAWWCEPCRTELPLFDALATARPDLDVVGVHADTNAANGAAMLNDLGIALPSYQDDRNLFAAHHTLPSVVPITVVIDEFGTVRATYTESFDSSDALENAVNEALS